MVNLGSEIPIYPKSDAGSFSPLAFYNGGGWVRIKARER
jgi:hypothetical protein